jgi:hypothetical protein
MLQSKENEKGTVRKPDFEKSGLGKTQGDLAGSL